MNVSAIPIRLQKYIAAGNVDKAVVDEAERLAAIRSKSLGIHELMEAVKENPPYLNEERLSQYQYSSTLFILV